MSEPLANGRTRPIQEDALYRQPRYGEDPYAAFADIFGHPLPAGRVPFSGVPAQERGIHHPIPPYGRDTAPMAPPLPPLPSTRAESYGSMFPGPLPPSPGGSRNASMASTVSYDSSTQPAMPLPASQSMPNVARRAVSVQTYQSTPDRAPIDSPIAESSVYGGDKPASPVGLGPSLASKSSADLSSRKSDESLPRSVSHVWSGLKKQVIMQRSASSTAVAGRKPITRGGRAIPTRSDVGAFALATKPSSPPGTSSTLGDLSLDDEWHDDRPPTRKASSATVNSLGSRSTIVASSQREPLVYPAMLGRVAEKFRERMAPVIGERVKNELTYKNAFTGSEAIDVIAYIIKTPDRNLALLLGRALDAQKLFHDVTYDNRLRDSSQELYQFTTFDESGQGPEPNGVFTLLSECYSPTCSRNRLCYSISCPRRLEQQARLNMKLDPGLLLSSQQESSISLDEGEGEEQKLWRYSVPPEVVESTPPTEQKRQEAIAELVATERQFVKALEYLRESWIKPLRRSTVLGPEARRDKFIRMVFLNVLEVHAVNLKFAAALTRRQQLAPVVYQIADVVLEFVPRFDPFVTYGAQQMYAKYEFEKERALNPAFAKFVAQVERAPESHHLELNGYLTKPTTRLARYPLLLDAILKRTDKENPDVVNIPKAISQIREFLFRVNAESGRAENRFALHQLNQALTFRAGEYVDLRLLEPKRQLVFKGQLRKRPTPGEGSVQVYLFDNAILFAKRKKVSGMSSTTAAAVAAAAAAALEPPSSSEDGGGHGREVLRVNSKPIPLQLLQLAEGDEELGRRKAANMIRNTVSRSAEGKVTFPLTFQHLGRKGYEVTLFADNFQARKTWIEIIQKQRDAQRAAADVFVQHRLYTSTTWKAQCAAPFDGGRRVLFGTDRGVCIANMTYHDAEGKFNPVCSAPRLFFSTTSPVTQLDVIAKHGVVLMLSERIISAFPLESLDSNAELSSRSVKQVAGQVTFYKVDEYLGKTLLTVVKSSSLSSTIRVLEPAGPVSSKEKRPPLRRLLTAGGGAAQPEGFKLVKPAIDIPSATFSLSFLRSHLCLGCARGFELLDVETGKFESLLDPADTSLDFVIKRESLRPISLYRIGKEFLVNYSDFSFFINSNGWRSRPDWLIQWESKPQHIVLSYPYLVAFDHNLIEIRNMDTELLRVIHADGIRFLHESSHDILYAFENERGQDEVASLNFWEKQQRQEK